jgi:hypothetical protein
MGQPKTARLQIIKIGLEDTPGTPVAPTLAVLASDPSIENATEAIERPTIDAQGGQGVAARGTYKAAVKFGIELLGNGNSGSPAFEAAVAATLQAAGLVIAAGVYGRQRTISSQKTITVYHWRDGWRYAAAGVALNLKLEGEMDKIVSIAAEGQGIWQTPVEEGLPAAPTYSALIPPRMADSVLAIGAYTPLIGKISLDLGNTVALRLAANGAGIKQAYIASAACKVSMDPEVEAAATHNPHALAAACTTMALSWTVGTAAGNRCTIAVPALQYAKVAPGERDNIDMHSIDGTGTGAADITLTPS